MLGKSQTLNLFFFLSFRPCLSISSRLQNVNPSIYTSWASHSLYFSWCLVFKNIPSQTAICILRNVHLVGAVHSHPFQRKSFCQISQLKEAPSSLIMFLRVASSSLKPEGGSLLRGPDHHFPCGFWKNRLSKLIFFFHIICYLRFNSVGPLCLHSTKKNT